MIKGISRSATNDNQCSSNDEAPVISTMALPLWGKGRADQNYLEHRPLLWQATCMDRPSKKRSSP